MTTTRFNTLPKTTQDLVFPDRRGYYSASPIPDLAEYFHKSRTDGISLSKGLSYTLRSAADAFERRGIFERLINSDLMAQMRGHNTCSRLNLLSSIVERISYPQNPTHLFDVLDYNNILTAIVTGDKQQRLTPRHW